MAIPESRFGYLWDPVDDRDKSIAALYKAQDNNLLLTPKDQVDWRDKVSILSQKSLGSCVAHAVLGAIRLKNKLDGISKPRLGNRLHVYWGARMYMKLTDIDSGSNIRDAFKFINKYGFMPEEETKYGYDVNHFQEGPSPFELQKMYDQKDKKDGQVHYYRVYDVGFARIEALKLAMTNGFIPVFGTDTTSEFLKYKSGILRKPEGPSTGGHAMYMCGYEKDCAYVANSWGRDFGEDGFLRMGWDYITWHRTRDIWCVAKAPYFSHLLEART